MGSISEDFLKEEKIKEMMAVCSKIDYTVALVDYIYEPGVKINLLTHFNSRREVCLAYFKSTNEEERKAYQEIFIRYNEHIKALLHL
nr:hypothetical protein [uncultured Flavobacterium sp.]